jgi:fructose-bisphosphate aldolase class 1
VAQIRERAGEIGVARERKQAIAQEKARAKAAAASQKRLDALERQGDEPWIRLDKLVDSKAYAEAVSLTVELRDLAARAGTMTKFEARLVGVRKRHLRRRGYLDSVKVALRR